MNTVQRVRCDIEFFIKCEEANIARALRVEDWETHKQAEQQLGNLRVARAAIRRYEKGWIAPEVPVEGGV